MNEWFKLFCVSRCYGIVLMCHNVIWLNAVGVHTELNGTSGSMLSQMLKGTPCLLRLAHVISMAVA